MGEILNVAQKCTFHILAEKDFLFFFSTKQCNFLFRFSNETYFPMEHVKLVYFYIAFYM